VTLRLGSQSGADLNVAQCHVFGTTRSHGDGQSFGVPLSGNSDPLFPEMRANKTVATLVGCLSISVVQ